jgi:serine/threonine-protein kinase
MTDRRIGRFRIVAPLGKGGMATVWRAEDELLGRTVALKLLADDLAESPNARRRFRHEAEIATMLDHPSIAPVYAHGEDGGATWMAMRLVEGETLAARLAKSLVPADEALRIAGIVADALGYAHAQGVVHRDVSSNNVMLATDGRVFVMDFGLARAEGLSRVTSTGVTMGTLAYLAPEVLSGAPADPRSDLYALGIVLYEMLTGSTPFAGERLESTAYRASTEDPEPPSRRRAGLPAELDAFVLKAIAREPGARFQDTGQFATALAEVRVTCEAVLPPAPRAAAEGAMARALSGDGIVYLAVGAIESSDDALAPLATSLAGALRARLPGLRRLHVVEAPAPANPAAWREFGREAGANAILAGRLRESGARVRLELWLADPEGGARLAGSHVDGLSFEPFALEDAAIDQARALLGLPADLSTVVTQAVRRDPAAEEHFAQALRYLERHDQEASIDGAIKLLERLTVTDSPRPEWFAALARACLAKLVLTKERAWEGRAAAACDRAAVLAPEAPETLVAQADLKANAGRADEAIAGYRRALGMRTDLYDAWIGLARVYEAAGLAVEAEDSCRHAIALRPADWRAYSALSRVYLRQGKWALAAEPGRRVMELTPDNSLGSGQLASAFHQMGRSEEAIVLFRRSIELQPRATAYTNLGAALYSLHRYEEAIEAFRTATALRPSDPLAWGNLGNACRRMSGLEAEAGVALDRAIALAREQLERNPADPLSWAKLADWLQVRGHAGEAEHAMQRALATGPENIDCLLLATFFHHERGERAPTLRHLRALLARGYAPALVRRSPQLSSLQGDGDFERLLQDAEAGRRGDSVDRDVA